VFAGQQSFATTNEAQTIAAEAALGPQIWSRYSALQDNYRQESTPFLEQRSAFGRIKAALATPDSAAGDLALIFNYMKILDPGSVVREGEFANAQNAGGVPQLVLTAYNRLLREGQRLSPEQRKDFFTQATATFQQARGEQAERDTRYLGQARDLEIPDAMLGHFQLPTDSPGGAPGGFGAPQGPPPQRDQQSDTTATMIGQSIGTGVSTAVGQAGDIVNGLGEAIGVPRWALTPIFGGRATDEYPRPPTAGDRRPGNQRRSRGAVSGVIQRPPP
jgi:hypothetical protein